MEIVFEVVNHHPTVVVDLDRQQRIASAALPMVLASPGGAAGVLSELNEIEVSIVDDPTIADVHDRFMNLPDPTDVITFDHGEILASADTAERNAKVYGHATQREIALYLIHGLLHLNGHEDKTPGGAAGIAAAQERILNAVWPQDAGSEG